MADLVSIQQSGKQIRNPFGFDFTAKWNKKPIVLKGDGQWRTVIAPLADHIANHLYMKIYYQFHDEQVAAMKAKGLDKLARGYRVPADVENKIMMLITGKPKHSTLPTATDIDDEADLTVLKKEIKAIEARADKSGPINVTKILEKANLEALPEAAAVDGRGETAHKSGSGRLSDEPVDTTPADTTPALAEDMTINTPEAAVAVPADVQPETPEPKKAAKPAEAEFGELNELDHD